jgi:hypothetical protein
MALAKSHAPRSFGVERRLSLQGGMHLALMRWQPPTALRNCWPKKKKHQLEETPWKTLAMAIIRPTTSRKLEQVLTIRGRLARMLHCGGTTQCINSNPVHLPTITTICHSSGQVARKLPYCKFCKQPRPDRWSF